MKSNSGTSSAVLIAGVCLVLGLVIGAALIGAKATVQSTPRAGSLTEPNRWTGAATTSTFAVGQTSIQVMPTSTNRQYVYIANASANAVYYSLQADAPATTYKGVLLAASSTYTVGPENLYTGSIQCISDVGTNKVVVTGVQ